MNPCPRSDPRKHLHVYPVVRFKEPNVAPAHCRLPSVREIDSPANAVAPPPASLLSTFAAVAGVQQQTSRSIKPRERDLRDLRLFVLVRFFTRPTNHPRHAACASNNKSKPVRPLCPKIASTSDCANQVTVRLNASRIDFLTPFVPVRGCMK